MINIWKYQDAKRIRITTNDNEMYDGFIVELTDIGERSDLEPQEDGITIYQNGLYIEVYQSEIKKIEVLE